MGTRWCIHVVAGGTKHTREVRMRMTWKKALADSAQKPHRIVLVLQSTVAWHTSGSLGL